MKGRYAYVVGDRVWWKGNAWRITHLFDTRTEGLRADMESLEHLRSVRASAQCSDLEGRLDEEDVDSESSA